MKFSLIVFANVVLVARAFSLPPARSPPLRYTHASKVIPDRTAMKTSATTLNAPAVTEEENGVDESYPWRFDGRFWFRPSFVRAPPLDELPEGMILAIHICPKVAINQHWRNFDPVITLLL